MAMCGFCNLAVAISAPPDGVLYSAVCEYDPNLRKLIFIVPAHGPASKELTLEISPRTSGQIIDGSNYVYSVTQNLGAASRCDLGSSGHAIVEAHSSRRFSGSRRGSATPQKRPPDPENRWPWF